MDKNFNLKKIKLTLVKSLNGRIEKHKAAVKCLGLSRINQSVIIQEKPDVMGMLNKVKYLLKVEEL